MKVVHVLREMGAEGGGPAYSVPRLCEGLARHGHQVELTYAGSPVTLDGVSMRASPAWPVLRRLLVSPGQVSAVRAAAEQADIVHTHSLWSMINIASGWIVPGGRARLVTSPRGTLSPWALSCSRHVKTIVMPAQRRAMERADLLHATSIDEVEQIRNAGFRNPVVTIPNGIDLPELTHAKPANEHRTLLYLSRIHPIKGIDALLEAWSRLESRHPDWRLVIAGHGRAPHVAETTSLASRLKLERVDFVGPLYGSAKRDAFLGADLFVLPTHSENFGVAVAEAMAHGCPVIVGRGAPWRDVVTNGAGWWVDTNIDALADALSTALGLSPRKLADMGRNGRCWMERDFAWDAIAARMTEAYNWVAGTGERPDSVHS